MKTKVMSIVSANVYYCPSSNISQDAGYTIVAYYTAGGGNTYT